MSTPEQLQALLGNSWWMASGAAAAVAGLSAYYYLQLQHQKKKLLARRRSVQDSVTHFTDFIIPAQCSNYGVLYGGELLAFMDLVGGTCAYQHCHGPCVTVSIDQVHFFAPAKAHEVLKATGRISAAFRTSVEVEVTVQAINAPKGDATRTVCTGRLVFVHMKREPPFLGMGPPRNVPQPVPALELQTPEETERAAAAAQRRRDRLAESKAATTEATTDTNATAAPWWKEQWTREEAELEKLKQQQPQKGGVSFVKAGDTVVKMSKVVMPQHANPLGITFGGQIMAWMEQAACMAAGGVGQTDVATVGLDRMAFLHPSFVGNLLQLTARVTRVYDSSLEVRVVVRVFNADSFSSKSPTVYCNSGYFTVAAVNVGGSNKTKSDRLASSVGKQVWPETDDEKREFCEAVRRREARLKDKTTTAATASNGP